MIMLAWGVVYLVYLAFEPNNPIQNANLFLLISS